ncbi:MAG: hypothetical protein LBV79_10135 [Candidatus Adiutrix sp.]|jgi:two-component system sensor histidine kinase HydH|nr:hypothetical protein [Candidatus Adiutrix sp.]
MNQRQPAHGPATSPWFIAAAVLGVVMMGAIMFNRDYRREQGYLQDMLLQRGEVLIHSLEMVGRVSFEEAQAEEQLLNFWNNLEADDQVLFLALTDDQGRLEALAGGLTPPDGLFSGPHEPTPYGRGPIAPNYRTAMVDGRPVYLVYRSFWPLPRRMMQSMTQGGHGHRMSQRRHDRGLAESTVRERPVRYLWVGFDLAAFEAGSRERVRTAAVFVGLLGLAVLAGVLALIWGHNSRLVRRLYQDTNALAAELIGRLPVGVILKDREGKVSLVNRSTLAISGLQESDFLGQSLEALTQGRFPAEETMSGRETTLSFNGGPGVLVALTSGPVVGDDGHPLGQVILMEDLGELGRLKSELGKKERLAALGSLAAGLAHEIRNPLGAIRGLSQHLLNKGPADPGDREALEVVLTSVDRLNATITDFLDYARPTELKTAPLDLGGLIRKMATLAGHDAQSQAVTLELDLPGEPLEIDGDEALLSQAFLNLYLNAIQAAGERPGGGGRLCVALRAAEQRAVLTFADNGPGFSPEQLAQPFVPYFTTKAEGSGLGLAMVEKAIRAHAGADVTLASPPSGGGLVTVILSLAEENHHEPDTASAAKDADFNS